MKIRYVYDSSKEVVVQSNFIPSVGDNVSLLGCAVPSDFHLENMKVVRRTYSAMDDSLIVILREEKRV